MKRRPLHRRQCAQLAALAKCAFGELRKRKRYALALTCETCGGGTERARWVDEALVWIAAHAHHRTWITARRDGHAAPEPGAVHARRDAAHAAIRAALADGAQGIAALADAAGTSIPSARRRVAELVKDGDVRRIDAGGRGKRARYALAEV